jgi:KTSC domain
MNRDPVESGMIQAIGYDHTTQTLEVEFKGGFVYQYHGVPASAHAELMDADSHGDYFHKNIKGQYEHKKA